MLSNIRNLLIIGLDTAALACSAKNTGHEVYCVDYFGDSDLKKTCAFSLSVIDKRNSECSGKIHRDFNPKGILVLVKRLIEKHKVDGINLIKSGNVNLEKLSQYLHYDRDEQCLETLWREESRDNR